MLPLPAAGFLSWQPIGAHALVLALDKWGLHRSREPLSLWSPTWNFHWVPDLCQPAWVFHGAVISLTHPRHPWPTWGEPSPVSSPSEVSGGPSRMGRL